MILIPRSTGTTARLEHPYLRLRQSSPPMCWAMRESGHFTSCLQPGQIVFSQERRGTGSSCRSEAGFPRWSPGAGTAILAHLIASTYAAAAWSLLLLRKDHQSIILAVELISATAVGASLLKRRRRRGISQEQQPSSYLKYHLQKAAMVQESMKLLTFCTSPSHLNQMIVKFWKMETRYRLGIFALLCMLFRIQSIPCMSLS